MDDLVSSDSEEDMDISDSVSDAITRECVTIVIREKVTIVTNVVTEDLRGDNSSAINVYVLVFNYKQLC